MPFPCTTGKQVHHATQHTVFQAGFTGFACSCIQACRQQGPASSRQHMLTPTKTGRGGVPMNEAYKSPTSALCLHFSSLSAELDASPLLALAAGASAACVAGILLLVLTAAAACCSGAGVGTAGWSPLVLCWGSCEGAAAVRASALRPSRHDPVLCRGCCSDTAAGAGAGAEGCTLSPGMSDCPGVACGPCFTIWDHPDRNGGRAGA